MDWKRIKKDYSGIVICPYLGELLFGKNANEIGLTGTPENITNFYKKLLGPTYYDHILFLSEWYRHQEAGTGIIWNLAGIKDIVLLDKSAVYPRILKALGRKETVNKKSWNWCKFKKGVYTLQCMYFLRNCYLITLKLLLR